MFKNKAEREGFLREYRKWATIDGGDQYRFDKHEITLDFYTFTFKNGTEVIVTECPYAKAGTAVNYNLIISGDDDYNPWDRNSGRTPDEFRGYNLQGVPVATIVDYMTKRKNEI